MWDRGVTPVPSLSWIGSSEVPAETTAALNVSGESACRRDYFFSAALPTIFVDAQAGWPRRDRKIVSNASNSAGFGPSSFFRSAHSGGTRATIVPEGSRLPCPPLSPLANVGLRLAGACEIFHTHYGTREIAHSRTRRGQ